MVFIVIRVYLVFMWNVFIGFVFYMILVVFFDEKFLKKNKLSDEGFLMCV